MSGNPHPKLPVHPHACGENCPARNARVKNSGTPPRLWGKLYPPDPDHFTRRYTPTPVGKTMPITPPPAGTSVHPHACGENSLAPCRLARVTIRLVHPHACGENGYQNPDTLLIYGTPPRLWGKPCLSHRHRQVRRYTPTPVGKTSSHRVAWYTVNSGTPPRLWGKRVSEP